jgi:photosystem II stability/assembly factor-like uncharacterized protein
MNRRDFLKTVAQTSLTALAAVTLPQLQGSVRAASPVDIRTVAGNRKLLGTLDGRIFESLDGGKTWQPRANFGGQCSILDIYERNGKIYAQVGIGRYSFVVESRDGRTWYTLNWVPQRA